MPDDDTTRPIQRLADQLDGLDGLDVEEFDGDAAPVLLVAAAVVRGDAALLARAAATARTTRDRQLAAIAAAHLAGDDDLRDALVRDHLADHPDSVVAAWIADQGPPSTTRSTARSTPRSTTRKDHR